MRAADAALADAASVEVADAAPDSAAPSAPPTSASEWAQRWLDALRARDANTLRSLSSYPFRFDDTNAVRGCQSGAAAQAAELEAAVACLFNDELLTGALKGNLELGYEPTKPTRLPKWAKRWRKDIAPTSSVIATEMGDNGISYFFVIVVAADGVQAVYRHAEFWPN